MNLIFELINTMNDLDNNELLIEYYNTYNETSYEGSLELRTIGVDSNLQMEAMSKFFSR